jgi:cysteinyl-tRNA synthetase
LILKEGKMAKSKGNIIILKDLIEKGVNPLAYRYLCLNAHYRSKLIFSWEAVKAAQKSLENLYEKVREIKTEAETRSLLSYQRTSLCQSYQKKFLNFINDDLNMPRALALTWKMVRDNKITSQSKYKLLLKFDKILGLGLDKVKKTYIPSKVRKLIEVREKYRKEKNWQKADTVRKEIEKKGYQVEDTKEGPKIKEIRRLGD